MTAAGQRAARSGIAIAAVALALIVIRDGLTTHLLRSDPAAAAWLAPHDARATLAAAQAASGGGDHATSPAVQTLAGATLARDLTDPAAVELRALAAAKVGDHGVEARLMADSDAIGRRSLGTRLWLIQQAVDRGDVAGALRHFDIALRTSVDARDTLFPVLAHAAGDPAVTSGLATILDRPSEWRIAFLDYAETESPADAAAVMARMADRGALQTGDLAGKAIGALVAAGRFDAAWQAQARLRPGPPASNPVRDPRFDDPRFVYPFGWDFAQADGLDVRRGPRGLTWHAIAGALGPAASQLIRLRPGRYALTTMTATGARDATEAPFWTLTCAEPNGPQLARIDQPLQTGATATAAIEVPRDCTAQWLLLTLRSSDEPDGQDGIIRSIAITPRS